MTEEAFKAWKDQTRQEALEKEVKRLRERSYRQSGKIGALQRAIYFTWFFFIVLFAVMLSKGMISIGKKKSEQTIAVKQAAMPAQKPVTATDTILKKEQGSMTDTLLPLKETSGILYCVQIGAFTGINLDEFNDNLISLQQESYSGINQLTLGRFKDYDKAVRFLDIVQQIGFHDAFIMSFRNGKRVPIGGSENTKQKPPVKKDTVSITIPYVVPEEKPLTDAPSTTGNNL